jgi:hypothetical protein
MFNDLLQYSIGTLVECLKLKKDILVQVALTLVKCQLLLLDDVTYAAADMTCDIIPDLADAAVLKLNTAFSRYDDETCSYHITVLI